ncbi:MAG: hydroxymethylbilane synthase [Verrucomicrobiota bacterium]
MKALRIGTRGSALALAQTRQVMARIAAAVPGLAIEEVVIKTTGDRLAEVATSDLPMGKGVFTAELENALLGGEIDVAVHSLKDLPTTFAPGLALGAVPVRADERDVLLMKEAPSASLDDLPEGALIATGSLRRQKQLARRRPDLRFTDIRGNIDTRIRKLRDHDEWSGLVLAAAGLERLRPDTEGLHPIFLDHETMLPAPGQGALALQIRSGDAETGDLLQAVHDTDTAACVRAERAFLHAVGGGCEWPLGAAATLKPDSKLLSLHGIYWQEEEPDARAGTVQLNLNAHAAEDAGARLARLIC